VTQNKSKIMGKRSSQGKFERSRKEREDRKEEERKAQRSSIGKAISYLWGRLRWGGERERLNTDVSANGRAKC